MCEMCGIGPLNPPCGIICLTDCSVCWVTVASESASADRVTVHNTGKEAPKLTPDSLFNYGVEDLPLAQVGELLRAVSGRSRTYDVADGNKRVHGKGTGTIDGIAKDLGLTSD